VQLERPPGDVLLIAAADEETGEAKVGAEWLVAEHADAVCADFVVGEGAGERYDLAGGPLYLYDVGEKSSCPVTLRVRGRSGDASLPGAGENALLSARKTLARLAELAPRRRVEPEIELLLQSLAGDSHPALDLLVRALTGITITATGVEDGPEKNVVPRLVTIDLNCALPPSTTKDELLAELRACLGDDAELEADEPSGGSRSPVESPLSRAIERFLAAADAEARLAPTLGYGYSDCHWFREAFGAVAYGFVPFRHGDPLVNLRTKHGPDERILLDDLQFQVACARFLANEVGAERA